MVKEERAQDEPAHAAKSLDVLPVLHEITLPQTANFKVSRGLLRGQLAPLSASWLFGVSVSGW